MTTSKLTGPTTGLHSRYLLPILPAFLLVMAIPARPAEAQCCQFAGSICGRTSRPSVCEFAGGQYFADRLCQDGQLCVRSSSLLTRGTSGRSPRPAPFRPARPVRPHGPHVTLAPAFTATPTPTPTPAIADLGCCELHRIGNPICSGPIDRLSCTASGGVFVPDTGCDERIERCVPSEELFGCCQLSSPRGPLCLSSNSRAACPTSFVPGGACNRISGICSAPPPRCGNGIVERGEECEHDAHCFQPTEGCTDQCLCAGAVEVLLRWTNQNDLDLSLVDPHGAVFVPRANANPQCRNTTNKPEEFIYLPPGEARVGCYSIQVDYERQCPESGIVDTHLDLRLNVEGFKSTIHDVPGPPEHSRTLATFGVRANCP